MDSKRKQFFKNVEKIGKKPLVFLWVVTREEEYNPGQFILIFLVLVDLIPRVGFTEWNTVSPTIGRRRINHSTWALQWFQWMDKTGAIYGWKDFTQTLTARFGPSGFYDWTGLLVKL